MRQRLLLFGQAAPGEKTIRDEKWNVQNNFGGMNATEIAIVSLPFLLSRKSLNLRRRFYKILVK